MPTFKLILKNISLKNEILFIINHNMQILKQRNSLEPRLSDLKVSLNKTKDLINL